MRNYYVRRTARVFVTITLVASMTFGLVRLLPGGPVQRLRARLIRQGMSSDEVAAYIEAKQNVVPDAPLWQQYLDYMIAFFQLDLGESIKYGKPVAKIVAEAAPWTIFIVTVSTILMFAIGIVLGALQAYWEGSRFDTGSTSISIAMMTVPFYVIAILLVWIVAYQMQLLPPTGKLGPEYLGALGEEGIIGGLSVGFVLSAIKYATLPIIAYTVGGIGIQALAMRGNSIQVLGEDFVRVARLRGLPDRRIATRYVARNAILPMYTGFLLLLGFRLGGTVILEQIFAYPGLGYYLFDALSARDYPLMMGTFLVITVVLVLGVYVADLTYGLIDPRIKSGESNESF